MSKLITNFGDSTTIGNTTLQQNLVVQGALSTFSGNILAGSSFSTLGNSTNKFNTVFAATANITTINSSSIFGTTGFVGINTTGGGATLNVAGNVYASNAIVAPNVFASISMNAATSNTANIFGTLGVVGVNINPVSDGASLQIGGNVHASNALSAPTVFATTSMNVTGKTNTTAIYGTIGFVGINTSGAGAALSIAGNMYTTNSIATTNIFATSANITTLNLTSVYGQSGTVSVGATAGAGSSLYVSGNIYASNAITATNAFVDTLNVSSIINTSSIYSTTGRIGINTSTTGANLHVVGNLYASNALTAPVIYGTTSINTTTLNTTSIYGTSGLVGINTTTPGSNLHVVGNIYATNAFSTTNVFASGSINAQTLNAGSIFGTDGLVGIGTLTPGASLHVVGNVYASNSLTSPNIVATGTIYYKEDLVKRAPYLTPNVSNATIIQSWISATCNACSKTGSFWSDSGSPVYGNAASGPIGSTDYIGGVLIPDGRVLFVPFTASNVGFFNPSTGLFSTVAAAGLSTAVGKFYGGALLPNGNVVFIPYNSANIGMFNPTSYEYSNILTIAGASGTLFRGGVLGPNGNVIFAPYTSGNVGVFNPTLKTYTNVGPLGTTSGAFQGGVLLPNGNVVFVPSTSPNIGMFNSYSMSTTTSYINVVTPATNFTGGVLSPDGNVVFVTGSSASVGLFKPSILSSSGYSSIATGVPAGSFAGGCLSPTGNVVMAPYASGNVGLYDPLLQVFTNVYQSAAGSSKFAGATQLPDGRVVFCPYSTKNVGVLNTLTPAGPEFCMSPYFNKY